jgi:uncharacterized membrane protein YcaP (DUF421 family)
METVLLVLVTYIFVWACFRVLGKRELTKMAPFEFVTLLLIPQMFSRALTRQDYSITNAIIGASTLLALVFLTSLLVYRIPRFASVVMPKSTILVDNGQFIEAHLNQERISPVEVFDAMHRSGIEHLADVRWALLQPTGKIAVIPMSAVR